MRFLLDLVLISSFRNFLSTSNARFLCGMFLTSARNSSDTIAFEIICLIAESSSSLGLPVGVDVLTRPAFTAW